MLLATTRYLFTCRSLDQQGFGSDGLIAGRQEGPQRCRIAWCDLRPDGGVWRDQCAGGQRELAPVPLTASLRWYLDRALEPLGQAAPDHHESACASPYTRTSSRYRHARSTRGCSWSVSSVKSA